MEQKLARYHELKLLEAGVKEELETLRTELLQDLPDEKGTCGDYSYAVTYQERKTYDDQVLREKVGPDVWALISKADAGKITSMLKVQVLKPSHVEGTFTINPSPVFKVTKI